MRKYARVYWFVLLVCSLFVLGSTSVRAGEAPAITLLAPQNITYESAVIRARVNPKGSVTGVGFYVNGISIAHRALSVGDADRDVDVSRTIVGLKADSVNTIVVKAENSFGVTESAPLELTTASLPSDVPIVTTLPPRNVTSNSAILRATIDPRGHTVYGGFVDIYGNGYGFGPFSGDVPVTVEYELSLRSDQPALYYARAYFYPHVHTGDYEKFASGGIYALNSASILPILEDRESSALSPPGLKLVRVEKVTENSAILYAYVNPSGLRTYVDVFLDGSKVLTTYCGLSKLGESSASFYIGDLAPATSYKLTAVASNVAGSTQGEELTFLTAGSPPAANRPPTIQPPPVFRINSEGMAKGTISAFDPDNDPLELAFTQGSVGTVTAEGWNLTYTPGPNFFGTDTFQVTVTDSHGVSTSAICGVSLGISGTSGGKYDLVVNIASDPPKPAGRLTLDVTKTASFSGTLTIFGAAYALHGSFDSEGLAVVELDRIGVPPLLVTLNLLQGENGLPRLSATIGAPELNVAYVASGEPIGDATTNEGVVAQSYTAILPMRSSEPSTPQGDGFLTGQVSRNGRARFVGRTGDGQTFSLGGRLQRNRELGVGLSIGKNPRDYLGGHLSFARDEAKTITGALDWISYRNPTEHYRTNFTRSLQPLGARYRMPKRGASLFGESGTQAIARLQFLDAEGLKLADGTIGLGVRNSSSFEGGNRVSIQVDKRSGFFRGQLNASVNGGKRAFSGVVVQPFRRGGGLLMLGGPVGAIEVASP